MQYAEVPLSYKMLDVASEVAISLLETRIIIIFLYALNLLVYQCR